MTGDRRYRRRSQIQVDPPVATGDLSIDPTTGRAQVYRGGSVRELLDSSDGGIAGGYAPLNGSGLISTSYLGTGATGGGTRFLADDYTWKTGGGGGGGTMDHASLTSGLAWLSSAHTLSTSYRLAGSGSSTSAAEVAYTAFTATLLDDPDAATARATLGAVGTSRAVSTNAPLTGGGPLSSDLTLSLSGWSGTTDGAILYRSGSSVASAVVSSPLSFTGGTLSIQAASTSQSGYLSSTDWNVFNNKSPAAGSTSIVTVGTITTGVWHGSTIGTDYGGTGLTTYTSGDMLYYSAGTSLTKLGIGTAKSFLTSSGSAPQWTANGDIDVSGGSVQVTQARGLRETSGPTTLTIGVITAGEILVRSGTTIASAAFSTLMSAYSALLAAIAGLGSNGFIVKNGSSAYARSIAAGSGITVTNGDGVSGNPVITASGSSGAGGGSSAVTLYGSARDGDVAFNGGAVTGWSLAGSTYTRTLARDPHYKTLTIATGYSLVAAGVRIRCRTLVMGDSCSITAPGGSASLSTAGTGSAPSAVATSSTGACFYGSAAGAAGRTSNSAGANGATIPAGAFRAGGAGGTGSTSGGRVKLTSVSAIGASGSAGGGTDASSSTSWHYYGDPFDVVALTGVFRNGTSIAQIAGGGSGGGGAASFLSGTGSSGGGGSGGGVCVVFAASASFGTGCSISANGGNGGNAGTGSTDSVLAGGHGGGGGLLVCVIGEITGSNVPTFSANGGNGGNASRSGTGYWAEGGNGGDGGNLFVYVGTNSVGTTPTYTANGGTKGTDAGSGTGFVGAANGTNSSNVYYNEGT